jgi:hypothetical protein
MSLLDRIAKQKEYDAVHPEEAKKRKEEIERRKAEEQAKREAERLAEEQAKAEAENKAKVEEKAKAKEPKAVKKAVAVQHIPIKKSTSKPTTKSTTKPAAKPVMVEVESLLTEKQGIYKYIPDLLVDKTTGENIIFAEDEYEGYGLTDHYTEDIMKELIASKQLNYRVRKSIEHQKARTKKNAEVFTPSWICKQMIEMCEPPKDWQEFVQSTWLEITCGECPFITSRYDATTGETIPLYERIGVLDRKMQAINKNVDDKREWTKWTERAFKTTYGYEFQGDNLFIARVNVLRCFVDYYRDKWKEMPSKDSILKMINIITWNFWQMDGLKDTIPFSDTPAKIIDWKLTNRNHTEVIEFRSCKE